jgi:hypothetical protein
VRVFTWNTQGDFTSKDKFEVIKKLFSSPYDCVAGFIQEGGVGKDGTPIPGLRVYTGVPVGSKNERCTNYVLLREDLLQGASAEFECFNVIGGGEAGRTAAAVRVGKFVFASWHSLAGPSNSDTSALIDECQQKTGVDCVVLGGDFNTTPDEVECMIVRKAMTRSTKNFNCNVVPSGKWTHRGKHGDKELDFFVLFQKNLSGARAEVVYVSPSDHNPVVIEF